MDRTAFTHPSGEVRPLIGGGHGFIPDPLPPRQLDMGRLAAPLARAMGALGEMKGAARRLSNPWLLIQPLQRQEALSTSAMEGTYTTLDQLVLEEARVGGGSADTREVANFIRALHRAEERLAQGMPITGRMLREAHGIMLSDVERGRGRNRLPGRYKVDQNMIGGHGIEEARYVPPPPDITPALMADLERFINAGEREAPFALVDLALVHYQFEAIHPFADGNGRMGRMLITLLARAWGLLDGMLLYVSPEIEARKDEYVDRMFAVSARSQWEEWIAFFMEIVEGSCARIIRTIDGLVGLHEDYRRRAMEAGRSANLQTVVDMLFHVPVLTAPKAAEALSITYAAAQRILRQLERGGMLAPVPGTRPQAWIAREILELTRR